MQSTASAGGHEQPIDVQEFNELDLTDIGVWDAWNGSANQRGRRVRWGQ